MVLREANAVLFITRKFPPSVGGMQKACYGLALGLQEHTNLHLISWGRSQAFLPIFLPLAFLSAVWLLLLNPTIKVIHLGDGLLSPLGWCLRLVSGKPFVVTAHGLDITYRPWLYQKFVVPFVSAADMVICVSHGTQDECLKRGVAWEKSTVIPNGVFISSNWVDPNDHGRKVLAGITGKDLSQAKLMLTVGRLVRRKGVADFIERVLPGVLDKNPDLFYLVVGVGPEEDRIRSVVDRMGLSERVVMLGGVDDKTLQLVYHTSDVFLMPNIKVEGDVEGFGIVALEACLAGLPVVAANVDGISEAIKHGKNGFLVEFDDSEGYVDTLTRLFQDKEYRIAAGRNARDYVVEMYSWERVAERYFHVLQEIGVAGSDGKQE